MRGWPSLEVLGLGAALALLVIPLHAFTLGRRPAAVAVEAEAVAADPTPLEVQETRFTARFLHPPQRFRVTLEGKPVWELASPSAKEVSTKVTIPWETDAMEVQVEADWPAGTGETVLELTVEPDGWETQSRTVWGNGAVDTVLSYRWP